MATDPKTAAAKCPTIESQLDVVNRKIVEYTAQKLPDLKTELEQVKKKKDDAEKEYKAKYEALKKLWCEQNDHVLSIRRGLQSAFPKWEEWIKACVCAHLSELRREDLRIKCRSEIKGRYEAALEAAQGKHDTARAAATAWTTAAKTISDQLAANGKIIDDLCKLTCTPDYPAAIYTLWFKLLVAHARLRPKTKCFDEIPIGEHPCNLCPPPTYETCRDCDEYEPAPETTGDCALKPRPAPPGPPTEWPLGDPWLIDPADYAGRVDCAFDAYLKAKEELGVAQRCFSTHADDLASVKAGRKALWDALDAAIEKCLKEKPDKGCCEKEEEAKPKPGCNDQPDNQQKGV